jgi:pimeloyl-ACP methyl ester carboxylesterase
MKYAAYRQVQLAGYPDADADRAVALRDRIDEFFRGNGSRDEADQLYLEARKEPWFGRIFLPDPSSSGSQWPTIMDLDIAPTLRQIQVPVLLVFGEDDRWVPIGDTLEVWRRALPDREAMDVVTIPGAGHSMTVAEDPDDWMEAGPLAPGYERELLAWLRDHVA